MPLAVCVSVYPHVIRNACICMNIVAAAQRQTIYRRDTIAPDLLVLSPLRLGYSHADHGGMWESDRASESNPEIEAFPASSRPDRPAS